MPSLPNGLHQGLSFPEYQEIRAKSHSDLRAWVTGKSPSGRALIVGRALHAAILEPDVCAQEFASLDTDPDLRTKDGKEEIREAEERTGKTILRKAERDLVASMVRAFRASREAIAILDRCESRELSAVSTLCGVGVRSRFDMVVKGKKRFLSDIKTTHYATPQEFKQAIMDYGYDSQGAMYSDVWASLHDGEHLPFVWICISKQPPHNVWTVRLSNTEYHAGKRWYETVLGLWSRYEGLKDTLKESVA